MAEVALEPKIFFDRPWFSLEVKGKTVLIFNLILLLEVNL
jgi:hypothetical protein